MFVTVRTPNPDWNSVGMFWMLLPFASTNARPVPMPRVPSVAMNEFTPSTVTMKALTRPKAIPQSTVTVIPTASPFARWG